MRLREADAGAGEPGQDGPVSIVVPTYNRVAQLERVLDSYLKQRRVKEVIVVDNGCVDDTPRYLKALSALEPKLRVVRLEENRRQSGARNAGAAAATGDYIFYGEDDYELTRDQIATLLDHLDRSGADIIAGRRINVLPGERYGEALHRTNAYPDPLIERWAVVQNPWVDVGVDVEAPLLDACALIRREVFSHASFDLGFLGNGWREESDFQLSALESGFKLVHCSHTLGFHSPAGVGKGRGGSHGRSRRDYEVWTARNNARFLRKHWELLRSGRTDLRVPPTVELAVALQAGLRFARAGRKLSRLAGRRLGTMSSARAG
jgi:glycosyltransferase involved in cell wall biosynthesis